MTSSYRKKMEELEADELRLKKEEEFDGKHYCHHTIDYCTCHNAGEIIIYCRTHSEPPAACIHFHMLGHILDKLQTTMLTNIDLILRYPATSTSFLTCMSSAMFNVIYIHGSGNGHF